MMACKLGKVIILSLVFCLLIGLIADEAYAQISKSGDKSLASKSGTSVLKGTPKEDSNKKTASGLQMAIGVGSIFVMIVVVKWL